MYVPEYLHVCTDTLLYSRIGLATLSHSAQKKASFPCKDILCVGLWPSYPTNTQPVVGFPVPHWLLTQLTDYKLPKTDMHTAGPRSLPYFLQEPRSSAGFSCKPLVFLACRLAYPSLNKYILLCPRSCYSFPIHLCYYSLLLPHQVIPHTKYHPFLKPIQLIYTHIHHYL